MSVHAPAMAHSMTNTDPPSPSSDELVLAIDSILGSNSTVLATDVPDLFVKYEQAHHGLAILKGEQLAQLRETVSKPEHAVVQMSRDDICQMINHFRPAPAPISDVATPTASKHARRKSARIRGPGDSSSTEEEEQTPSSSSSSMMGKRPISRRSFPDDSSAYILPSTIATSPEGALPSRNRKISNMFDHRSSIEMRPDQQQMPSRRNRPAPQSRRSSGHYSTRSEDDYAAASESTYKIHGRTASAASVVSSLSRSPGATSPISPPGDGYCSDASDSSAWRRGGQSIDNSFDLLRDADEVQRLSAVVSELRNRIKTLEHEREGAQQTHEDLISAMEQRMENDKQEHDIKVKEQMGRTEQKYRTEIEAKEAEITEINESLGLIFAKLADVQAALEHEKNNTRELRGTLQERENDISGLRMELHQAGDLKQQVEEDLGKVNAHNADLQEKVDAGRAIEINLAGKILEINALKTTVSDMDKQLTDLKGGTGYGGGGISSAGPATLTRNGGTQLSSELQAADPQVQTVYLDRTTTHTITRTIQAGGSEATYKDAATETMPIDVLTDPEFAPEREAIRQQVAAEMEPDGARTPVQSQSTLAEEALRSPPAYSASPGPADVSALMKHTHPIASKESIGGVEDLQNAYDLVSKATGRRCTILEERLEAEESLRNKYDGAGDSKPSMVGRVYTWATTLGFLQLGGLIAFTVFATQTLGTPPQRDPYDSFAYNGAVSWFEHTAAMARAGRVPT